MSLRDELPPEEVAASGDGQPPSPTRPQEGKHEMGAEQVNHPDHYNQIPGIEVIDVVKHLSFCRGNAVKYLLRAGHKDDLLQDLKKARWYVEQEISDIEASRGQ